MMFNHNATESFRAATVRHGNTAGITRIPAKKKCVRCEKHRTLATGRETSAGFVCGMCGGKSR